MTVVPAPSFDDDVHLAAVQRDERARDGEAEAGALVAARERALHLLERAAELFQRRLRNADAGILDDQHDAVAPAARADA